MCRRWPGRGYHLPTNGVDTPLTPIIENVQGSAKEQVAYMVDMAKADALDLLGETRQAFELVDRCLYGLD